LEFGWGTSISQPLKKMFKVIVLACSVAFPSDCWEYHDTRGPYESMERCQKRAYKMGNDIAEIHKGRIMPKKFRCVALKGTQL
jgi:hypothetical protein